MRRAVAGTHRTAAVAVLLLSLGATACGNNDAVAVNGMDPELVVGIYDPTALTFDVEGSTFGVYDLLAGFADDDVPPQLVLANNGAAQLAYLDPQTGFLVTGLGSYAMLENGVRLSFNSAADPGKLLLPRTLDLTYDDTDGTLSFSQVIQVPLNRLVALAPELDGEPLADPVGGLLTAVFTPR